MVESGRPGHPVASSAYDETYFLEECEGNDLYLATRGRELSPRLEYALSLANVKPGEVCLDLGCGRGEVAAACLACGATTLALDYSPAALGLARSVVLSDVQDGAPPLGLLCADVTGLPLADGCVDVVFMLDLVEHLWPEQLADALDEVSRILRPSGRLIVHTMPNKWYYSYGYPLYRIINRFRGKRLPIDPRARWRYVKTVHVNEQDIRSLSWSLALGGFCSKVWVDSVTPSVGEGKVLSTVRSMLARAYPLNLIFCNDIFAVARKRDGQQGSIL